MNHKDLAAAYAAKKTGRRCEYVGGGRFRVWNVSGFSSSCVCHYLRTSEIRAAINK